jgi:hypothetical protein
MEWEQKRGLIIVGAIALVGGMLYLSQPHTSNSTPDSKDRTATLTQMELAAPCGQAEESFYLAAQAGKGNDATGLLAMIGDGRLYEVEAGTELHVRDTSDGMSVVFVNSGSLIGKTLCMQTARIQ